MVIKIPIYVELDTSNPNLKDFSEKLQKLSTAVLKGNIPYDSYVERVVALGKTQKIRDQKILTTREVHEYLRKQS
jgi:hypothetical protein